MNCWGAAARAQLPVISQQFGDLQSGQFWYLHYRGCPVSAVKCTRLLATCSDFVHSWCWLFPVTLSDCPIAPPGRHHSDKCGQAAGMGRCHWCEGCWGKSCCCMQYGTIPWPSAPYTAHTSLKSVAQTPGSPGRGVWRTWAQQAGQGYSAVSSWLLQSHLADLHCE